MNRTFLGLLLGLFLAAIEATVVATAMPRVIADLGGQELYSLPFSLYLLLATVSGPLWGRASDLSGRRRLYLVATGGFLVGSALSGASQTMHQLIWARSLQGLGAGGLLALTFTMIGELYPMRERARVQGFISGVWGISGLVGPLVGGFITDRMSWRWVFYLNIPFALVAMTLIARTYRDQIPRRPSELNLAGAVLFACGAGLLVYGIQRHVPLLDLIGVVLLGVFFLLDGRRVTPLIPFDAVRHPLIGRALAGNLLAGMAFFGSAAFLPLFGQAARGQSATGAGALLAPMTVGWTVASIWSARWLPDLGPRPLSVIGAATMVTGFGLWAAAPGSALWVLGGSGLLAGLGMGAIMLALLVSAQEEAGPQVLGIVTGLLQFARNFGGSVGAALMGAVLGGALSAGGTALFRVFWRVPALAALLALLSLAIVLNLPHVREARRATPAP
ncbi:MAG: MFS transporter [Armatimonadota bacterium]|nr:MFS transporter [Armatimonadota bacterium]MDR7450650.1 MFS transporter [Armatimonadota bacterium]MDR7466217.1 MFS transporter [Armatimonadota bacterium]MDR7492938.1 MFS transporter [Armatimonadota bacterium]MDR7498305.1 MFS transporter [Armatimonadota bacterium]